MSQSVYVENTPDPEHYPYGVHWPDFTVNLTVAPDNYHVRPQNGLIVTHLEGAALGGCKAKAMVQAIKVAPGDARRGSIPKID
jgi:hypothetical protein